MMRSVRGSIAVGCVLALAAPGLGRAEPAPDVERTEPAAPPRRTRGRCSTFARALRGSGR